MSVELDAQLCELLEKKPSMGADFQEPKFWEFHFKSWRWLPIPVSTDWIATGKVIEYLEKEQYTINAYYDGIRWQVTLLHDRSSEDVPGKTFWVCKKGASFQYALTLAAKRALEDE